MSEQPIEQRTNAPTRFLRRPEAASGAFRAKQLQRLALDGRRVEDRGAALFPSSFGAPAAAAHELVGRV